MAIRIFRTFWGGYTADTTKLNERKFKILRLVKPIISTINTNQGFGKINGTTKKLGANFSPVPVCVFRRDNRQLLWETISKADGTYSFRNIALGLECFIVAFDPNNQYNAVIQDKLTPFDGRVG
ncbi:carboxypeptidase regulatory-like domain-containing protein [Acinetobacter sp. Ac_5812]|uniref:carboxypeptidase regulatory-like domain-containing protein n=1 Tax=Acinetobacter sp. Ac_5812 TaxID=1848937 RepID=UPI0014903EE0|nr:carboxypeptidase regulatory-like domain-containing protein [Acinetobacter sp. Ac_5812]NNP71241.1 hypothetical protein [Acinetobacter sp. Ac_5812]